MPGSGLTEDAHLTGPRPARQPHRRHATATRPPRTTSTTVHQLTAESQSPARRPTATVARVAHETPLAYLLGIEGIALLRSLAAGADRDFVESRVAEIRTLLDEETLTSAAMDIDRIDTVPAYREWSRTYDDEGNTAFDVDQPVITQIVDALPAGTALDAACGTGRIARLLADRGHRVLGVDSSPDMLARARTRVPEGTFLLGDLTALPIPDAQVDLVVCALALTHSPDLTPVMAEFSRVLRPDGHLLISDMHPETVSRGLIPPTRGPHGQPARITTHHHSTGDYLRAALTAGLHPRRCEEPVEQPPTTPTTPPDPPALAELAAQWEYWPWCPSRITPQAARAAWAGIPSGLIWHFQRTTT